MTSMVLVAPSVVAVMVLVAPALARLPMLPKLKLPLLALLKLPLLKLQMHNLAMPQTVILWTVPSRLP